MIAIHGRDYFRRPELAPVGGAASDSKLRPSRKDALPENTHYTDSGCDLHPSCLSCPLIRCRYDEPGGARRLFSDERDRRIVRLQREEELSIDLLAARFGVSRRTVFRVLARDRAAGAKV